MKVFIGWDDREPRACNVAANSLIATSGIDPEWLRIDRLRDVGLLNRLIDRRGQAYDLISNAPVSTDFAISRFLVPILCQSGWALFTDCDVLFLRDVRELLEIADPKFAVMCVKHRHVPIETVKMDNQAQTFYARKNWSSVMLFNCDHPANRRLTVHDVNTRKGLDLHQLYWCDDSEIGALPPEWNWLVNVQDRPARPAIAHYTLGGPWFHDWQPRPYDQLWLDAEQGAVCDLALEE